ncbi:UNVERIFIED_CONTAM: hypothetical protein K2H54_056504 [Gekko kuhli]
MRGAEEDIPGDYTPVTTVPVTIVPTTTVTPVTTVTPTTLPALPGYQLLDLGGLRSHIMGTCQKMGGTYKWSVIDSNIQESWSLTPEPARESWYEYEVLHKTGTHPQHTEEDGEATHLPGRSARPTDPNGGGDGVGNPVHCDESGASGATPTATPRTALPPPPSASQDQQVLIPAPDLGPAPAPGLPRIILKKLLHARFDGTPKKLAFLNAWGHLFPSEARMVDYIAAQLQGGVADWYVSLHQVRDPELHEVDTFMQALQMKFEDPLES